MTTYRGYNPRGHTADPHVVTVDRDDGAGERLLDHPPGYVKSSEFSWGYGGSGPAELARCLLADHLGAEPHPAAFQAFKSGFVAAWPSDGNWTLSAESIDRWLAMYRARDHPYVTVAEYEAGVGYDPSEET